MKHTLDVVFHDEATVAADGTAIGCSKYNKLTIEIYGTSTTRTVAFKAKSASGTLIAISGVNLSDLSTGVSTTGTGELWQFDVVGLDSLVMDLTAVAGGNVSVKGKLVADCG